MRIRVVWFKSYTVLYSVKLSHNEPSADTVPLKSDCANAQANLEPHFQRMSEDPLSHAQLRAPAKPFQRRALPCHNDTLFLYKISFLIYPTNWLALASKTRENGSLKENK